MVWLIGLGVLFTAGRIGAAANFNYDTKVTYNVQADGSTTVTEDYTVTNNTDRLYLSGIKISTPSSGISGIRAAYADGGAIPVQTATQTANRGDLSFPYQQISLAFPRILSGNGRTWEFKLTYTAAGLVDSKGGSRTVYIPAIQAGDVGDNYTATLEVPTSFGTAHFAGAQSSSGGVVGDRQIFEFAKADLTAQSLALAFGDETVYNANFNFPLNNSAGSAQTMTVTLPPDLDNQHVVVKSLKPAPTNTRLDADGNILADYRVPAHTNLTVVTDVAADVKYLDYNLSKSGKLSDIPADVKARYTGPDQYWQTAGAVATAAAKITDPNAPVINNVKAIYQFVIDKLSYNSDKIKFNIRQGAAKALTNPTNAVCLEYADLTIAMLRSQGIPARMPVGYAYSGSLKTSPTVEDSLHAWVEVYVPGIGWMELDPTWGEKFDEFGHSDLDHFAFAVWGQNDAAPVALTAGGRDSDYQYEATKLTFSAAAIPPPAASGSVRVTRYAILPFVAIDHVDVTAQAGVTTDNNAVTIGSTKLVLGSLAPSQQTSLNNFSFGGGWLSSPRARFSRDGVTLAAATGNVQAWPMITVLGLIVAISLALILLKLRRVKIIAPPESGAPHPPANQTLL